MALGLLRENEINCHLKDEHIVTIDPLLNPAVGGIKLMVADTDVEFARTIIKDAEEKYIATIPCPNCHHTALVMEEKINNPTSFWKKLGNMIAYGQESTYKKIYRCNNCQQVFTDLLS
jgi:DNA-directed RNA polymerase subunit RPC12/RpoP